MTDTRDEGVAREARSGPREAAVRWSGAADFDWPSHPLNLRYREAVRAQVGDPSFRNPPTPIPTPEQRREKELERALAAIKAANAIRSDADTRAAQTAIEAARNASEDTQRSDSEATPTQKEQSS